MSLLYPLYALAAIGIAAPVLFHLFQRKPQGRREFSSLIFLRPTPPKVTSRSRLSDLLLLLCRALILLLVALAFSRPFFRSVAMMEVVTPARSVILLVDTSASMRRDGVWLAAQESLGETMDDLRPEDRVSLVTFDRLPRVEMSFEAWDEIAAGGRISLLQEQVKALQPTWHKTDLATALTFASDLLLQEADQPDSGKRAMKIVVCSDLQEGSDLSSLQAYKWPSEVLVQLATVEAAKPSNASLQWLPPSPEEQDSDRVRVLIRNETNSQNADLKLSWDAERVPTPTHVPPGQTRVVKLRQPPESNQLTLHGDGQSFDNQAFIPTTEPIEQELWFLGEDNNKDHESLLYYVQRSPLDTRQRTVQVRVMQNTDSLRTAEPERVPFVILEEPSSASVDHLRTFIAKGGRLLVVLPADQTRLTTMTGLVGQLLEWPKLKIENHDDEDGYAMVAEVDFKNPLFVPFADPRFNDFTKIRFWSHRLLSGLGDANVIARFDDESPALVEKPIDQGVVWVLASGWQPSESQLAMSTKFVPLLNGFFDGDDGLQQKTVSYEIGDTVPLRSIRESTTIKTPDGQTHTLDARSTTFDETDQPGMYTIRQRDHEYRVAVNLAKEESRTDPIVPGRLEQLGVDLGEQRTIHLTENEQRQMRNKELESRQKFWRWGVLGALGLIAGETWLSRRRVQDTGVDREVAAKTEVAMHQLQDHIENVGRRFRRADRWRYTAWSFGAMTLIGLVLFYLQISRQWMHQASGWWLLLSAVIAAMLVFVGLAWKYRNAEWLVEKIEASYPELDHRLATTLGEVKKKCRQATGVPAAYAIARNGSARPP